MRRSMRRTAAGALMFIIAGMVFGIGVGPALAAEIGIAVGAPESATVGTEVEVKAIVTSDGEPLEGAVVALTYSTSLGGVAGRVELVSSTTDAAGIAVMFYEQRAADNGEMRIEYVGPDDVEAAPFVFTIAVNPDQQQLYFPVSGVNIPFLNGTLVIAIITCVWAMIVYASMQLVMVGRENRRSVGKGSPIVTSEEGSAWIATVLTVATILTAVGMVIVFLRAPFALSDPLHPESYDRSPIAFIGADLPYVGVGLADPALAETGDPLVDGELLYFQYGCASCHGISGRGAVVGPKLIGEVGSLGPFLEDVRVGPKGMPGYSTAVISDEDVEMIHTYLKDGDGG